MGFRSLNPTVRKWFRHLPNVVLVGALGWLVLQRLPTVRNNFAVEGTVASRISLTSLRGVQFHLPDEKLGRVVLVFWATWCGPCRLELSRFRSAVESGEIDSSRFFAIDTRESKAIVEAAVQERGYPFTVLLDAAGIASDRLQVNATPTIVHLEGDGTVSFIGTGLQPFSVSRAAHFLAGK